ncbi:hypothetical protein FACS1894105_00210 [Clostridia bacterium]|nr:hypothetical protein FACS1894105_00210 [Clostridia bacterium]
MSYTQTLKDTLRAIHTADASAASLLRSAFIDHGSVSDPEKRSHLEFALHTEDEAERIASLLESSGIRVHRTIRRGSHVIYIKDSAVIGDLLFLIGAKRESYSMLDAKILKDYRNFANRVTNFENANIGKISKASAEQIAAIESVMQSGNFGNLPRELQEAATLRLENIGASLAEIGTMCNPPVTKSAVLHRMKRLMLIENRNASK